jgi:peptidoglycan/LPS O-acetylase OafA/YrhL
MKAQPTKVFFPNLDGLRFFSFMLVFFAHIFPTSSPQIQEAGWYILLKKKMFVDGDLGVSFFFVLSGFLITYLLLKEKELRGHINAGAFYVRRILRIWPLYYFCVFFGFVIFPLIKQALGQPSTETADPVLSSFFLNNFNAIVNGPPDSSVLSVLWSVAIEEQFYLVWPLLFIVVPASLNVLIFIFVVLGSVVFRYLHVHDPSIEMHSLGVMSDLAIGGLGAYLVLQAKGFKNFMEKMHPALHLIPYMVTLVLIVYRYEIFGTPGLVVVKRLIIAFFFIWIILEQNFSARSYFKISQLKIVSHLGKYTYGLYCLHTIAVLIVMVALTKAGLNTQSWQLWLIEFPLTFLLSVGLAYASYHLYEKHFLKLKNRFAYIRKE